MRQLKPRRVKELPSGKRRMRGQDRVSVASVKRVSEDGMPDI